MKPKGLTITISVPRVKRRMNSGALTSKLIAQIREEFKRQTAEVFPPHVQRDAETALELSILNTLRARRNERKTNVDHTHTKR